MTKPLFHRVLVPSLAAAITACSAFGGSSAGPTADLTIKWTITNADGTAATCPSGYDTVRIDAFGKTTEGGEGWVARATAKCADGQMVLPLYRNGTAPGDCTEGNGGTVCKRQEVENLTGEYRIVAAITEASGEVVKADALPVQVSIAKGPNAVTVPIYPTAGYAYVGYRFSSKSDGTTLGCASSGVDTIELHSVNVDATTREPLPGAVEHVTKVPCAGNIDVSCYGCSGGVRSTPLPSGDYEHEVIAFTQGKVVGKGTAREVIAPGSVPLMAESADIVVSTR
jgi:hypothetical protein